MKLILGTSAFGQSYGIKGDGIPSLAEIEKIATVAWDGGIRVIHTSWQYNLPEICNEIFSGFEFITKDREYPEELFWYNQYGELLKDGLSVYQVSELERLVEYDRDILQIPVNIFDRRFLGQINNLHGNGLKEIHARSVFLQGLLLIDHDELPDWTYDYLYARSQIDAFQKISKAKGLKFYEAALGWVLGLEEVDKVIVGVNNAKQLEELLAVKPLKWDYDFSITDENVLDPRRWPKS